MRKAKLFNLNLKDITDKYLRDNLQKIEGYINDKLFEENTSVKTTSLKSSTQIDPLRLVSQQNSTQCTLADNNKTHQSAVVLGVSINGSTQGKDATIQTSGELSSESFTFSTGDILYLGSNAQIVNTKPIGVNFVTVVGHVIERGKIFINIQSPQEV